MKLEACVDCKGKLRPVLARCYLMFVALVKVADLTCSVIVVLMQIWVL